MNLIQANYLAMATHGDIKTTGGNGFAVEFTLGSQPIPPILKDLGLMWVVYYIVYALKEANTLCIWSTGAPLDYKHYSEGYLAKGEVA